MHMGAFATPSEGDSIATTAAGNRASDLVETRRAAPSGGQFSGPAKIRRLEMKHRTEESAIDQIETLHEVHVKLSAADYLPTEKTIPQLRQAAAKCEGCELYLRATQTVFGEGAVPARLMFIGEAPGDQEDEVGHPFVGPASRLLDEALEAAGIDRTEVYLTNAVKHFKWEVNGKRRLHAKPSSREIAACQPWIDAEIELVSPRLIVCLGATAAQSLLGRTFRITQRRGVILSLPNSQSILSTWHPSSILRTPDTKSRRRMREELIEDLKLAVAHAAQ